MIIMNLYDILSSLSWHKQLKKLPKSIVCIKYFKMCAHTVNFAKNYSQNVC